MYYILEFLYTKAESFVSSNNERLLLYFIIFIFLIICSKIIKRIKIKMKGISGERKVKRVLSRFEKEGYIILNDIMLPLYDGTTQIDHVIIGPYGVTAIETKNYAGRIYGALENKYWVQELGRARNEFYNPLKQNETHVKTLKYILKKEGLHYVNVENLVVFTSKQSKIFLNEPLPVLKLKGVKNWIQSHKSNRVKIEKVADVIGKYIINDASEKRAHVQRIKKAHKNRS